MDTEITQGHDSSFIDMITELDYASERWSEPGQCVRSMYVLLILASLGSLRGAI